MSDEIAKSVEAVEMRLKHIIKAIPKSEHVFISRLTSVLQSIPFSAPENVSTHADHADTVIEGSLPRIQDCYKPWQTEVYARWCGKK